MPGADLGGRRSVSTDEPNGKGGAREGPVRSPLRLVPARPEHGERHGVECDVELSFIASAVRRRWWLVPLGLVLGALAGTLLPPKDASAYEARAVLIIQPPQNPLGGNTFVNDPDRYVIGQLSVLQSSELAARLADKFPGETTASIRSAVSVEQAPKTDIVTVTARSSDPAKAERLANAWAELYISDLRDRASAAQGPALESVKRQIDEINSKLTAVQQTISDNQKVIADQSTLVTALASQGGQNTSFNPNNDARVIAAKEAITTATAKVSEAQGQQQLLLQQYNQFLNNRSQLELAANLRVASEIVQPALVPILPTSSGNRLFTLVGAVGGAIAGLVATVGWARVSSRLVDARQVEEALGHPVVGLLSRQRAFQAPLAEQVTRALPDVVRPVVHQLCVRAEARSQEGRPLRLAVIGSMHGAGCTSVAVALATQFASTGARVVLVDADQHDPEITTGFGATTNGGIPAVLARAGARDGRARGANGRFTGESSSRSSKRVERGRQPFTDTDRHEIKVLGFGSDEQPVLRREDIARLLDETEALAGNAQVFVVDGGALLGAASTVQLAQMADAVVVAIPFNRQTVDGLADVVAQLPGVEILPVLTTVSSRPRQAPFMIDVPESGAGDAGGPVVAASDRDDTGEIARDDTGEIGRDDTGETRRPSRARSDRRAVSAG
jgi:Mrp family chromosome partitioning ATPase